MQDRHTLTLRPFQMLSDHKSICTITQESFKRGASLEARRVWCHDPQPHTENAEGLLSQGPSCHPPTLTCYILTSSVKWLFGLP